MQSNHLPLPSIESRFHKSLILFAALFMSASTGFGQGKQLTSDDLFQTDKLVDIQIQLPESDWEELTSQTRSFGSAFQDPSNKPFSYVKGDITIDGVQIKSVGIRKKGFIGSLDDYRPSLKIKFDEYVDQDPVKGVDRLTLNNNKQDYSLVSQHLTYKTFREAGLHAPRNGFARVTVNGEYLGLYSNIESIRKPFLKSAFGKASGALYEGTLSDLYPKAMDRIEIKSGKDANLDRPLKLAEWLAADGDLNLAEVEALVDVDYFLNFWAIESLIGFWDGYANNQNNYFIYDNPENGKFYFIPWGADGAFDSGRGMLRRMGDVQSTAVYAQAMLVNRLYWAGDTAQRYDAAMRTLLENVWKEEALIAEIDRIEKLFSKDLHERQADYKESMNQVREFVRARRGQVTAALAKGSDGIPTTPRKPMYSIPVGEAKGSFATTWGEANNESKVDLNLVMTDEVVEFTKMTASAGPMQFRGFGGGPGGRGGRGGGPGGRSGGAEDNQVPPVSIELSGVRKSDNQSITLTLMIDQKSFIAGVGSEVEVNGFFREVSEGGGFGRPGGGMKSVSGTLKLNAAGAKSGDAVGGTFDLNIVETRGGMFSRR